MASHKDITMRRFILTRTEDVSGTSGIGVVAEGIEFSNGQVVLHWVTQLESVAVYASLKVLEQVHGHGGKTIVKWLDLPTLASTEAREFIKTATEDSKCSVCKGAGWYDTGNNDLICSCPAGELFIYSHGNHGAIVPIGGGR